MTWEEYYAKFFDWSESTQIRRLSDLRTLGSHKQVAEIVTEFLDEKAATRLANKAMDAGIHFTAKEIMEMADYVSRECLNRLVMHVIGGLTPEQVDDLYPSVDEPVFAHLVLRYGSAEEELNRKYEEADEQELYNEVYEEEFYEEGDWEEHQTTVNPPGFLELLGLAELFSLFRKKVGKPRFRIGAHVRVIWRGQEGTIIDYDGIHYMVSLKDGELVDSYTEDELEEAW